MYCESCDTRKGVRYKDMGDYEVFLCHECYIDAEVAEMEQALYSKEDEILRKHGL